MTERSSSAARGASPATMRLREFHTGRARLRPSASAFANHCASLRKCAARSRYGPARIFLDCILRILAGGGPRGAVDGAVAIAARKFMLRQQVAYAQAAA